MPLKTPAVIERCKRPAGATVLRIRRQRRRRMAGHFDFRHDGDVPRRRIFHHLADVVLRVKSAVTPIRAVSRRGI